MLEIGRAVYELQEETVSHFVFILFRNCSSFESDVRDDLLSEMEWRKREREEFFDVKFQRSD